MAPRGKGIAYFEVKIDKLEHGLEDGLEDSDSEFPVVSIGLSGEFTNLQWAHPGWSAWSVAYNGYNGNVSEGNLNLWSDLSTGHTYGYDCTVGCGIDYESAEYLFTLNGQVIGMF